MLKSTSVWSCLGSRIHTGVFCGMVTWTLVAVLVFRRNILLSPVPRIVHSIVTQKITVTLKKIPVLDGHFYWSLCECNVHTVFQDSALLLRKEFLNTPPLLTYVVREYISRNVGYKTISKSEQHRIKPHSPLELLVCCF